jgi:transposase
MQHISGISRSQMRISNLEDAITLDNQVRFINAFLMFTDLTKLGFSVQTIKSEGLPNYHTRIFLKIYLYGYLSGIRSSLKLEKECFINYAVASFYSLRTRFVYTFPESAITFTTYIPFGKFLILICLVSD